MQKKASILALYKILNKHSDYQHPLKRNEIEYLLELEYDMKINRKTLHDHFDLLNEFGCDISTPQSRNDGYYLNSRLFETSEVHLLCNAINAVHFIPQIASNNLIEKLLNTQSEFLKSDFHQTVYMKNMRKSLNKEFFLNIEILMEAIQDNKPVSFNYMRYNLNKVLIARKDHEYLIHPYYIIYANENYYLICNNDEYDNLSHYRIDKIKNIKILNNLKRKSLQKSFDPYTYAKSKIYMYGGEEERITLKCDYFILDDIIDRFGNDVILQKYDEKHFLAIVRSSKQGILYLCLQYLKYCEVTVPLDLRNEILKILTEAIYTYE